MAVSDNYPVFCAIINFMFLMYENYKLKIACKKWENVKNLNSLNVLWTVVAIISFLKEKKIVWKKW